MATMALSLCRRRLYFLHKQQQRILHLYFCSAISSQDPQKPFAKFLLTECGFTEPEFKTLEKRFKSLINTKSIQNWKNSLNLFRSFGFTEPQIKKIIATWPAIIRLNAGSILHPKLERLQEIGFSAQQITEMATSNPRFLTCSLESRINPNIETLENIFLSKDRRKLLKAILSNPMLLCWNIREKNVAKFLKENGIQDENIRFIIVNKPSILIQSHENLVSKIEFAKSLGILMNSGAFSRAMEALAHCNTEKVREKMELLRGLGFSVEEVRIMFCKDPRLIKYSCVRLRETLEFCLGIVDYDLVARNPCVFNYSLEKCLRPRYRVVKHLIENGDLAFRCSIIGVFKLSKKDFLDKYVNGREDSAALLELYQGSCVKS